MKPKFRSVHQKKSRAQLNQQPVLLSNPPLPSPPIPTTTPSPPSPPTTSFPPARRTLVPTPTLCHVTNLTCRGEGGKGERWWGGGAEGGRIQRVSAGPTWDHPLRGGGASPYLNRFQRLNTILKTTHVAFFNYYKSMSKLFSQTKKTECT